jgi:hypothetical protein
MWPLPRELLWAAIITLAIVVISEWPSQEQLTSHIGTINSHQMTGSEQQSENPSGILGIHPGEWLLGIVTWMLWAATARLVKGGETTSRHQLRAYIYLEKTHFEHTVTGVWKINYRIKNFGQTPAHNVRILSAVKVVDWNGGAQEIPIPSQVETVGSMAPGGDFFEFEEEPGGSATFNEIEGGTKAIFLVGNIVYDTMFETERLTNFRYYIGGDVGCDRGRTGESEMYATSEGNDAT